LVRSSQLVFMVRVKGGGVPLSFLLSNTKSN